MKRDADWISMFGCDELAPMPKDAPAIPLDDELFTFLRVTSSDAADKIIGQVEDSALMETIVGECQPSVAANPLIEFTKRATARLQEIERRAPQRKLRIRKMLRRFADQLPGRECEEFDFAFDRLAESCLQFVTQTCLLEA